MTGHPTHTAPIDEVLNLVDRAIEVILTIFTAAVGYGAGSFVWSLL